MADFINTIDALGDDAVIDSIINRTITEYADDKLTVLGERIFSGCSNLQSVNLPNVKHYRTHAFAGCTALTDVSLPELVDFVENSYAQGLFYGCSALKTIRLPKLVRAYSNMFFGCSKLSSLELPLATTFAQAAAENCKALTVADFPKVTSIDARAFWGCSALKTLILRNVDTVCTIGLNTIGSTQIESGTGYIYVPSALYDSYRSASNWSTYADQFRKLEEWTVDGTVTGAFDTNRHMVRFFNEDGTFLGYVIVPNGGNATFDEPVKGEDYAFTGWSPDPTNVTEDMDCYAQFGFTGAISRYLVARTLESYEDDVVKSVRNYAFYNNTTIISVSLPAVTSIGSNAFYGCTALTTVNFPLATTTNMNAFAKCTALTRVDFPALNSIGNYAFSTCSNLEVADFHVATSIGDYAFQHCTALTALILRKSQVVSQSVGNPLQGSGIESGTGYIYVPRTILDSYKADSKWSAFAEQFRAIEDYPEICGGDA